MVIKAVNFFMIGKQKRKRKKETPSSTLARCPRHCSLLHGHSRGASVSKAGQSRFFNPISYIFFNYLKFIFNFLYKKKYVLSR